MFSRKFELAVVLFVGILILFNLTGASEDLKIGVDLDGDGSYRANEEFDNFQDSLTSAGVGDTVSILPSYEEYSSSGTGHPGLWKSKYVTVQGNYAYMNMHTRPGGLVKYDVSDPREPVAVDTWNTPYLPNGPNTNAVQDGYVFMGLNGDGLGLINANDSGSGNIQITNYSGWQAFDVDVEGDYAYLADTTGKGLVVFDISEKADPNVVANVPSFSGGVRVSGDYAYFTNYLTGKLEIYDISNPENPSSQSNIEVGNFPVPLEVKGSYAFVQEYLGNVVHIVDVSDPSNPSTITGGKITLPGTIPNGGAVRISGDTLYATTRTDNGGIVSVFDITDKSNPKKITQYSRSYGDNGFEFTSGDVKGTDVYLALYHGSVVEENKLVVLREDTKTITNQAISNPLVISPGVNASRTAAHWNEFMISLSNRGSGKFDATLNYWGSDTGPIHVSNPEGTGAIVSDEVIYSPWLANSLDEGTGIDTDPDNPGVQLPDSVNIMVDDVGPAPTTEDGNTGYLNQAIWGSNELTGKDTVHVRSGTYETTTDQPITDSTDVVSCTGCPTGASLNGELLIEASEVSIGRRTNYTAEGFNLTGDVSIASGVDASTVQINWNNIYGTVTNNGSGTLDATYNWWGDTNPDDSTVGSIDYQPYLPDTVCSVLDYMEENDIENPDNAIAAMACGNGSSSQQAVCELTTMGLNTDQAQGLLNQYGLGRVLNAMNGAATAAKFGELLGGYSLPAGAAGGLTNNVVAGGAGSVGDRNVGAVFTRCDDTIEVNFPLADFQGNPTRDLTPTVSLVKLDEEGNKLGLTEVTTATYSDDRHGYLAKLSSCELSPGYYLVQIDLPDLSSLTQVIEVEAGKE